MYIGDWVCHVPWRGSVIRFSCLLGGELFFQNSQKPSSESPVNNIWYLRCFSNKKVLISHAQNPGSHPKNCGSSYGETYLQSLSSGSRGNMTINLSNPWPCSEFEASRSYMTPHIKSKNGNSCFLVISEILKYFLALKARLWLPMWCHVGSHYFKTQLLGLKRRLSVLEHKFLL